MGSMHVGRQTVPRTRSSHWVVFTGITTLCWGVWGVFLDIPEQRGIPASLSYIVWALTMVPPCLLALKFVNWQVDKDWRTIVFGVLAGSTGGLGILLLAKADAIGPTYIIFPLVSLAPAVTIALALGFLGETATKLVWVGVGMSLIGIFLLAIRADQQESAAGVLWLVLSLAVLIAWGVNSFFVKLGTQGASAESILLYMTLGGLALVPLALWDTDFTQPVSSSISAWGLTAGIQMLNAIGVWTSIYAYRYGKAIIVSPCVNALYPSVTVALSLAIHAYVPPWYVIVGIAVSILAVLLMVAGDRTVPQHSDSA